MHAAIRSLRSAAILLSVAGPASLAACGHDSPQAPDPGSRALRPARAVAHGDGTVHQIAFAGDNEFEVYGQIYTVPDDGSAAPVPLTTAPYDPDNGEPGEVTWSGGAINQ